MPCNTCGGSRMISLPREEWPPNVIQPMRPCPACAQPSAEHAQRQKRARLDAMWPGLSKTPPAKQTVLKRSGIHRNMRLRCNLDDLKSQLSLVARATLRRRPDFLMRVCSDIDLIASWLYSAEEVHDPEASEEITRGDPNRPIFRRLPDLINPPDLLVLRLGLKLAPNRALPDVVLETLLSRQHLDRPTWIVERLGDPLNSRYPCYSQELAEFIKKWPRADLSAVADEPELPAPGKTLLPVPTPAPMPPINHERLRKIMPDPEGTPRQKNKRAKRP